jgi:hypothetical protein
MAAGTSDKYNVKNGTIRDVTGVPSLGVTALKLSRRDMAQRNADLSKKEKYIKDKEPSNFSEDVKKSRMSFNSAVGKAKGFREHAKIVDKINPEGKAVTPTEDYSDVTKIDKYKSGGAVKASRGDGIAQRGKTRGRIC